MKRLAQAVLVQALIDFTRAQDRGLWSDASRFLFPRDPDRPEFLDWTLEVSSIDRYRFRANLTRMAGAWLSRAMAADEPRPGRNRALMPLPVIRGICVPSDARAEQVPGVACVRRIAETVSLAVAWLCRF